MESSLVLNMFQGEPREVSPANIKPGSPDSPDRPASLRSPTPAQRVSVTAPSTRKRRSSTSTLSRRASSLSPLIRETNPRHSVARHHLPNRQEASSPLHSPRGTSRKMTLQPMLDPRDMVEQRAMQSSHTAPGSYIPTMIDIRPRSPNSNMGATSSLSGTIDEFDIPPQLRNPASLQKKMRTSFSAHTQVSWHGQNEIIDCPSPFQSDRVASVHQHQSSGTQPDTPHRRPLVQGTISPPYSNPSGVSSNTSPFAAAFSNQNSFQSDCSSPGDPLEDEIRALRKKVKELKLVNEHSRLRIKELERELARGSTTESFLCRSGDAMVGPPPTQITPTSSSVQSSWKARTDARTRIFCSLNRAGNALCSWHDSRRERRAYPPRMAPVGYLNCGCTYEEALFEESLSRHGVGGYHPGETVRMDPALRNPLLCLLQERYNYRDGDFERDPTTGRWVEGEGHVLWEQKSAAGALSIRKARSEDLR